MLLACSAAEAQERTALSQQEIARIGAASDTFANAVVARDVTALSAHYSDDGVLYPPGETAVKGRPAIEACLAALPPMKGFALRIVKVEGRDDIAYVQGTYTMTISPHGASEPIQESGYYIEVRRRQPDGRWLIAVHMLTPHN